MTCRRAALTALIAGCALGGCTAGPSSTLAAAAAPPVRDAAPSQSRPASSRRLTLDGRMSAALAAVVRLRQLPATAPIGHRMVDRDEMVKLVLNELDTEIPKDAVGATEDLFYGFGLVDADFDYRAATVAMLDQELGGLYVPRDKTLYVDAGLHGAEGDAALSHELVHALQDQHYDLGALTAWKDDASDVQSAVHALAEGDATSAMLDVVFERQGRTALDLSDADLVASLQADQPHAGSPPGILLRSLLAPYIDGTLFVHRLRRAGGWSAVDDAWRHLPASTEQMLDADKWSAREPPEDIPIPTAPASGLARVVYHDVLGEQSVRVVLEEWTKPDEAARAARGWAGDRVAVFAEGERRAAVWHIRYDSAPGAALAFSEFKRSLSGTTASSPAASCAERPGRGPLAILVSGRDVVVVAGPFVRGGKPLDSRCRDALATAVVVAAQR